MKKFVLLSIFALLVSRLYAADYYWVGGAGSWTELNHWASVSGGVPNKSIIPGQGDNVFFDANSGLVNGSNIVLPSASPAYCNNMSWAGVTAAANFIHSNQPLYVYGSMELAASVRYGTQGISFVGGGAATLKMNGAGRIPAAGWYNPIVVNKPGGTLSMLDGIPEALVVSRITLTAGTLDMSDMTHNFGHFTGTGNTARNLDISNATLVLSGSWDYRGTNNTINTTGSFITAVSFNSDRFSFPKVDLTGVGGTAMVINNTTFGQLTYTSPASPSQSSRIGSGNTIDRLEFKGGGSIAGGGNVIKDLYIAPSNPGFSFAGNNTITGTLHANTPDCDALSQILGFGANATITFGPGAVVDVRNVFMTNLAAAGSITLPITVTGADGGGNTGWDFQPRATGTTLYWVGGAGEWNDKSHWASSSGGAGGYCVPFTGDDVVFDANSGFSAGNNTVNATSGTAWCRNMTWTNVTGSPVFENRGTNLHVYGSLALNPALTLYGNINFKGTDAATFTANGFNLGLPVFRVEKTGTDGGVTFVDNFTHPNLYIIHNSGKLIMANRTLLISRLGVEVNGVRTQDISNSTITVEYEWSTNSTNNTWVNNAAGSFIIAKHRFLTNGLTYPKVHSGAVNGNVAISNATLGELVFTGTDILPRVIALYGNNTIDKLEFIGGAAEIRGNNTINNLILAPSRNYIFRNTQTINGQLSYNNPDCSGLGEMRGVAGTNATLNFGPSSTKNIRNVLLENMTATGAGVPVSVTGADAGGNTGFNITSSAGGARYWVGGSGDWNDASHWSLTPGGAGGACVPTVANDVFFNANSFSSGSSTVTIASGNAYCRSMNWTGASNAPVLNMTGGLRFEVWGDIIMSPSVTINAAISMLGTANGVLTTNGNTLGTWSISFSRGTGNTFKITDNFVNPRSSIGIYSGNLDLSGRTITAAAITDQATASATSINVTNATINASWNYVGANKTLQAAGSVLTCGYFRVNGGTYNKVNVTTAENDYILISNTTVNELLFSHSSGSSEAYIGGGNNINLLEFKGRGVINGTGNTIGTLVFAPGKTYILQSGSNNTITGEWYGSGSPCNPTQITTTAATAATVTKTSGTVDFDYVRLSGITAAGVTPFIAREHSTDLGNNTNWTIEPYNNTTAITGLGPDFTKCAEEFPLTLDTDGFHAAPTATYLWNDGSTNKTLTVATGGKYYVRVSYPDGCTIPDTIYVTRSTVTVAPVTGTMAVCNGETTTLQSATAGGAWSTSNAAIASIGATGVVTGTAPGTATITYTVSNSDGCSASQTATVTVNAIPPVNDITGNLTVFQGSTTTLSNTTPGGVWSSGNTAIATVSNTGVVSGVAPGTANITYTVTSPQGCDSARTVTVTVDGFTPAKRVLSVTNTADAGEPATNGSFAISLPAGVVAEENITINYTVGGTAGATDYTPLSGTATISAGQNSVALPVTVADDAFVEITETVVVTLSTATGTNYTYTLSTTNGNATVNITDDENTADKRILSVINVANAVEGGAQGMFRISLPTGVTASEDISVSYTFSGTATSGTDYTALSGSVTIPTGQPGVDVPVVIINDMIIEGAENVTMTLTGGATATIGSFTASATQGSATLNIADDDNTTANRTLEVTNIVHAAEPGTNGSFTIALPAGVTAIEPITVSYAVSGTASGTDYTALSGTVQIPASQNSVVVPITVTDDAFVESVETVILTINNGASATFAFTASTTAGSGTVNITDNDNTTANRVISITKTADAAEPGTNGTFRVSLPAGVIASENITVTYNVTGTATPGTDYTALTAGNVVIAAGTNGTNIQLAIIDNTVIENTETVTVNLGAATAAGLAYTISATNGSATINITDNDFAGNNNVVLVTKVSDAIEGGTNGQFRISLQPGVTISEDVVITFTTGGAALRNTDYNILGLSGSNIVIPAGANEVYIDIDAGNDGIIEGPENVALTLTSAASSSYPFIVDPSSNSGSVNIIDANAASSTPLQVITGANASEPAANGTFTVKLAGVATSAWPVTVGYRLSGTATSGLDYQGLGSIVIPANTNAITVNLNVLDDQIIEPVETMTFTLLSGSATDGGGNAFIFPPDPANNGITVNIADNDAPVAANRVLSVTKNNDAAEPSTNGSYTVSLPAGYRSSANTTLSYTMSGSAARNTDYTVFTITLPAYQNSITIPVRVTDDKIIEDTETLVMNLNGATDGNSFTYSVNPTTTAVAMDIADDDLTPANMMLYVTNNGDGAEPFINGGFRISLPAGITSARAIDVNYTVGGTAAAGSDYTALPATFTIPVGKNSIIIPVIVNDDQLIENVETVTLTINGGTANTWNFTPAGGSSHAIVNITDEENTPANTVISIAAGSDATEGTADLSSFTISLPAGILSPEDITVAYTVSGTALSGTDYTALSGTAVIPAGQNNVVVSTPAVDDQVIEGNETIMLTLTSAASNGFSWTVSTTANQAASNIIDNDNIPANRNLAVTKVSDATEPGTGGMFRISLPAGITVVEDVTVNYAIAGTATPGADYTALTGTAVIPTGQGSVNVPVSVIDDQVMEPTETVVVTLAGGTSTSFTFAGVGDATVNIADDENVPANLVLNISKTTDGAEPTTNGGFSISLPAGVTVSEDVTVSYTVAGSAAAGTDYAALSGTAVIPAGQTSVSFPVTVTDDQLIEQAETVIATLTGGTSTSFTFTGAGNATVNITDDESTSSLALTISKGADGAEPATNGSFTISLPAGVTAAEDVTVNYTISGTAVAGNDYSPITAAIIIPAGQNSISVPVTVADDQVIEATETVIMTLAGGASASFTFTGTGNATVNITDNESTLPANLALSISKGADAAEPGTSGILTISLPTGISVSEDVTVNFTAAGTATADADYAAFTGTAVIPAGQNSVSLLVAVIDDQLIEGSETVTATLAGGTSTSFTFTGTGNATVNIADDDNVPANMVLNVTKTTDAGEPSVAGIFNIAMPAGITATEDIIVNYSITGTSTPGVDHLLSSGTVVIPAGVNSVDLPLIVTDDQLIENTETAVIQLSGGSNASFSFTATGSATMDIADDDNTPENMTLSIVKTADAAEPGTNGSFSIGLPAGVAVTEDITVNYTVSGAATAGADYTALSGTVVIPADQNSVSLPVAVINDNILEATETVIVTLTGGASTNFTFSGTGNAILNIADDESTVPANLALTVTKGSDASESGVNGSFNISLPTGIISSADITVNYTIGGTAGAGTDYTALTGTVVIPAGQSSVTVPVTAIDDQVIEATETVLLTLNGGTSGSLVFTGTGSATVNITDNDAVPANLALTITKGADAAEPATNGNFVIGLPTGITSSEDITVNYTVAGTASSTDYTALSGTVVIPAGQNNVSVPVTVTDDQVIEVTETVIATLTGGTSTSFTFTGTGNATVNITDDESTVPANLALTITKGADGSEPGTNGSFNISLPTGITSSEAITVNYTVTGTATSGADYTALTGTVTIPVGQNSVPVPVAVANDDIIEVTETVIATLNGGSSANFTFTGTGNATVNITDDESTVPANLALTVTKGSDASESGVNGSFNISLPGSIISSADITVNYTTGGTAGAGTDYTALTGTVIIPAGQNSITVPVIAINDQVIEQLETVVLTLNGGTSGSLVFTGTGSATVNIADNDAVPNSITVPVIAINDQVIEQLETVVLTLNGGTSGSLVFTGTGSATVNIADNDAVPANLVLNAAKGTDAAEPATNGAFTISLPAGFTSSEAITVNYTTGGTATAGTDYSALSGSVVIPAGQNSISVPVTVTNDLLIENDETITLTVTGGSTATGLNFTAGTAAALIIADDDDDDVDVIVSASTPAAAENAANGAFTVSIAGGKTTPANITVAYTISGTATAGADYTALTGTIVIPAGSNSVVIPVSVMDDDIIEPGETVIVTLGSASASGFTVNIGTANNATVNIADNDNTDLSLQVTATVPAAAEPATNGGFRISLAGGKRTAEAVTVRYTITGTATSGADYSALTGTVTIPAGQSSVTIPVQVINDEDVEDPETVLLQITGGQSATYAYTAGTPGQATVTITSEDVERGDLTITKEIVQPAVGPYRLGQDITYRITVRNIGNGIGGGVVVTDTLPVQLGLPLATRAERGQVNVAAANRVVIWTIGDVAPGATLQMEVRCRITEGGALVAGAEVLSGTTDPDMTNNKAVMRLQIDGQDLSFPTVFTPNGDGKNERFIIGGLEKYQNAKLQVFNRWGGQVYRSNDYRNDWNGSDLLESTYYYILEVRKADGSVKSFKGWVLIVR
ncbi:Calx-beta domain-containing protein [Chitinophaga sp. YIM B06452]|uniref:Calx-beta domain-containing protein n=1 Tax=Chitinophaga sp. YIM B06452 TaxID=3082158 RepID=UPI0031FF0542